MTGIRQLLQLRLGLRSRVGLALGGGAAKGAAHIGVLRALDEQSIKIEAISGTSVGAAIAALYAFDKSLEDIYQLAQGMTAAKISRFTLKRKGFSSTERIRQLLIEQLGNVNIEEASIPLAIIAADIRTGDKKVFRKGSVADAVAASAAIPGIFIPVEIDGHEYVDGGIVENVPVSPLRAMGANTVIAVNLNGVQRYPVPQNALDVVSNALDIAINSRTWMQVQAANVHIALDLKQYSLTDNRDRTDELIDVAYQETRRHIGRIQWQRHTVFLQHLHTLYRGLTPLRVPALLRQIKSRWIGKNH